MSAPWTPEEIAECHERCRRATPGPWEERSDGWTVRALDSSIRVAYTWNSGGSIEQEVDDQIFIANARTDLPRALDHIEAQAAEIERLKAALDEADDAFVAIQAVEYSAAFVPEQYEVNVDQIASAAVGRIRAIRGGA